METDWKQVQADLIAKFEKDCQQQMKLSAADRDFAKAGLNAKRWTEDLRPVMSKFGERIYSELQVAEAACLTREDVSAILQIQLPILRRLDSIKKLVWACLIVLLYVGYKLS